MNLLLKPFTYSEFSVIDLILPQAAIYLSRHELVLSLKVFWPFFKIIWKREKRTCLGLWLDAVFLSGFALLKIFSQHLGIVSSRIGDAELHDSVMGAKERLQGQCQKVLGEEFQLLSQHWQTSHQVFVKGTAFKLSSCFLGNSV